MHSIEIPAYAKINLWLDVAAKREDGFHDIVTIMQQIDLHDTICIEKTATGEISLLVEGNADVPCDERNIAWKAARLFLDAVTGGVRIRIVKRIPVSAGMAGGSSDAAAVFLGMNALWGTPFSIEELCNMGAKIGSDVPFCIVGGTQLCRGRGEVMVPQKTNLKYSILVANSGETVSAKEAYALVDTLGTHAVQNPHLMQSALENGDFLGVCGSLYNRFEDAVLPNCPLALEQKKEMIRCGASGVLMSGSGATVFAIFPDDASAMQVKNALPFPCFLAHNLFS